MDNIQIKYVRDHVEVYVDNHTGRNVFLFSADNYSEAVKELKEYDIKV